MPRPGTRTGHGHWSEQVVAVSAYKTFEAPTPNLPLISQ